MLYMLIPHFARTWEDYRFFTTYAAMESRALDVAKSLEANNDNPDWCIVLGYDGTDEIYPTFLYSLVGSRHLHREPYPTPSP